MNGRPFHVICFWIFVVANFACVTSSADTIAYTNYDAGMETNTSIGWSIGVDEIGSSREVAAKFNAGASGRITQIDFSAGGTGFQGNTPPDTEVRVVLYGNDAANNRPGSELWSAVVDVPEYTDPWIVDRRFSLHFMSSSFAPQIQSVLMDPAAPILTQGKDYWFAVYSTEGFWTTWFNSQRTDVATSVSSRFPETGSWFTQDDRNGGLFRVHVVPKPNAWAMLAFGSCFVWRQRRR